MWMLKAFSLLAVAQAQIAPTQTMLRKAVLQKANSLLNSTVDDTLSCVSSCPLDGSSLSPSPLCLLSNCTSTLAKCLFSSTCRNGLMCELHCTEPLAKTEDGLHFATLMECVRVKCPGFPPSKSCVALHCTEEAAECAIHSKCRHALECANGCVPAKYEAALQLVQENTAVAV